MKRHLTSGRIGTCIILCLLLFALAIMLAVGGAGKALADSSRAGPPGLPGVLLATLAGAGAQEATEGQPPETGTANTSSDATLGSLTVTGDDGAIPLSPAFDPETTLYTTTGEADQVLVEAATAKDTATNVAFAVNAKTVVPEPDEDKLTTRLLPVEGAVTHSLLTAKAEDGATFETYHVLFARQTTQSLPEITIEASRSEYVAGIGPLSFTVTRTGDTTSDLDLNLNFEEDEEWLGFPSHPITIFAGNPSATLTFRPSVFPSYVYVTRSGVLTATVAPVSGYDTSGATVQVRVISQEEAPVTVSFDEAQYSVDEGVGEFSPVLVARAVPGVPYVDEFSVAVLTKPKEANSPADYSALSQTIEFLPGDFAEEDGSLVGRVEVPVTVLDDGDVEGAEQFGLELSIAPATPWGVSLLDSDGTRCLGICFTDYLVTIQDNDTPTLRFDAATYTVDEGGSQTIIVRLNPPVGRSVTIPIIRTNRGGANNRDYSGVPEELQFNADQTSRSFTFTTNQDTDVESSQSVRLSFGTLPAGVLAGTPAETIVSITDDDVDNADINVGPLGVFWRQDLHPEADGNEITLDSCAGTKSFQVIWSGPEGNRRADEWEARFTGDAASSVRYTFSESLNTQGEYFEMNATVGMTGETVLTMQVRGRFDSRWGQWSPKAGLFCLEK